MCDTAPMVALVSADDDHHARCSQALSQFRFPLVTTWPCLAEAMHLLYRQGGHYLQDKLWAYFDGDLLVVHSHSEAERQQMRALMRQYSDTPMDLADASLVAAANTLNARRIFTLDSDFFVYRLHDGNHFEVWP